jgi:hypothetical protein
MTVPNESGLAEAVKRQGSVLQTLRAVAWSFFGVRKGSEYEKDVSQLNPIHVVIVGLVAAACFIFILIGIVNWVLSSGIAQ